MESRPLFNNDFYVKEKLRTLELFAGVFNHAAERSQSSAAPLFSEIAEIYKETLDAVRRVSPVTIKDAIEAIDPYKQQRDALVDELTNLVSEDKAAREELDLVEGALTMFMSVAGKVDYVRARHDPNSIVSLRKFTVHLN